MAKITPVTNEKIFQLKFWAGLHESADGDTKLKMGEAAVMQNFRVTRDGNLQKRPGTAPVVEIPSSAWGACRGIIQTSLVVGGNVKQVVYGVFGETLYSCWNNATNEWSLTAIDRIGGDDRVCMFNFSNKLYIIANGQYFVYDGTNLKEILPPYDDDYSAATCVAPYVPLVTIGIPPAGGGTLLEGVNKLTACRRVWLSPSGGALTFQLPEKDLKSIDSAVQTSDGTTPVAYVTPDATSLANGTITFTGALSDGTNTIEVRYTVKADMSSDIHDCWQYEFYNGDQNNRIFLYGAGGSKQDRAYYNGLNYNGESDPTYWPDLNEIRVGDDTTSIMALARYNSRLICFKEHSTYTIQNGQQMLADGSLIPAFYVTPVHKTIGCSTYGQVQLVENVPVAMYGKDIYTWSGNKFGGLTADERQCKRISDRVYATLRTMEPKNCHCFDDNYHKEYYISDEVNKVTVVWNYVVDAWYVYTGLSFEYPFVFNGTLYFGTSYYDADAHDYVGTIQQFEYGISYDKLGDLDRTSIPCYWESGSMDFGVAYQRKYSAMLWVALHPEQFSEVWVTCKTDRSSSLTEKLVGYGYIDFWKMNFNKFTFRTSHRPKLFRLKIKAKKFVYYKLIFRTDTADSTATVTGTDIRVRFTGYAK